MATSFTYTLNGFNLTVTCGTGSLDGVVLHPDSAFLDNPAYLESLKALIQEYPVIHKMYWIKEWFFHYGNNVHELQRRPNESILSLIEDWEFIQSNAKLPIEQSDIDDIEAIIAILEDELSRRNRIVQAKKRRPSTAIVDVPGYVYLVQSPTGAYKIGRSQNPANRVRTFNVKLPFEIEYVCVIQTPRMKGLEKELHQRFAEKRIDGEWFRLSADDVDYIKSLAVL